MDFRAEIRPERRNSVHPEKFERDWTGSQGAAAGDNRRETDRKTGNTWTKQGIEFQAQEAFVSVFTVTFTQLG